MRKILSVLLVLTVVSAFVPVAFAAGAEVEYTVTNDFENWNAEDTYPGPEWTTVSSGFSPVYDAEKDSTVMKIDFGGEPLVKFGEYADKGSIHISFDMKIKDPTGTRVLLAFYDGTKNTILSDYNDRTFMSKMIMLNREGENKHGFAFNGNANSMTRDNWTFVDTKEFDCGEWHRYDLVLGDISSAATAYANYYVDGECVNDYPVPFSNSRGFKAFMIRVESNGIGTYDSVLVDNFYMRHFTGEPELKAEIKDANNVDFENAILDMKFYEKLVGWENITSSDIKITNENSGQEITDLEIIAISEEGLKIKINETLAAGKYKLSISDKLKGNIYQAPMSTPLSFRTKYRTTVITNNVYADQNFNSYAASAGTPPDGWAYFGNSINTVKPGEGKDGSVGMLISRSSGNPRPHYALTTPVPKATSYAVEFDMKHNGGQWYMYLLEERDMERIAGVNHPGPTDRDHYNSNIAIGMYENDTALGYASVRSSTTISSIGSETDAPVVTPSEWHRIKLYVDIVTNTTVKYTVSVDGGKEYEVISERAFATEDTTGIAFASKGELCIDNLKVSDETIAMYPEVANVQYFRCGGAEQANRAKLSTATERIDVIFNDKIDTTNIENNVKILGIDGPVRYEVGEDNKTVSLYPERGLGAASDYTISVSGNIASAKANTITMGTDYIENVHTMNDADFNIYYNELTENEVNATMTIKAYKTDNSSAKYTLVVASYKTATSEDGTVFEELVGVDYKPVEFTASERGFYEYSVTAPKPGGTEYSKAYLIDYPAQILTLEK